MLYLYVFLINSFRCALTNRGDMGHELGHMDAAHLWDKWSTHRPAHLQYSEDEVQEEARCGGSMVFQGSL